MDLFKFLICFSHHTGLFMIKIANEGKMSNKRATSRNVYLKLKLNLDLKLSKKLK